MKLQVKALIAMSITLFLSGCVQKEVPECLDPDVTFLLKDRYKTTIKDMYASEISNPKMIVLIGQIFPSELISLSDVKSQVNDLTRTCSAKAKFDNNATVDIKYTVKLLGDDNENFSVKIESSLMEDLAKKYMPMP